MFTLVLVVLQLTLLVAMGVANVKKSSNELYCDMLYRHAGATVALGLIGVIAALAVSSVTALVISSILASAGCAIAQLGHRVQALELEAFREDVPVLKVIQRKLDRVTIKDARLMGVYKAD